MPPIWVRPTEKSAVMLNLGPMPEAVRRAVKRLIMETDPAERWEGDERLSGLFLAGGPGGSSYLDTEGEVWNWSAWDGDESIDRVPDGARKVSIVALAAKRMPELEAWLPARPSEASNCEACQGSGWLPPPLDRLQCPRCLGLGWLVSDGFAVEGSCPMRTKPERWMRHWEMFERGLLSNCEIVHPFLDELDTARIAEEWSSLPDGYRELVRRYIGEHPPESVPRYFIIGCPTEEEIERRTEIRRRNAAGLVAYLRGLENSPPD
jgi:hypothetical protein